MASERVTEVRELASVLWFLPPPGRAMIADKLHGLGVRVHGELATLQLEREGPKELGAHAPMRVVKKASMNEGMEALRQINPALAARIDAAKADPEMAAKIAAAETAAAQAPIAEALGINITEDLKVIENEIGKVTPEDLE
jgi:hypothetical protein